MTIAAPHIIIIGSEDHLKRIGDQAFIRSLGREVEFYDSLLGAILDLEEWSPDLKKGVYAIVLDRSCPPIEVEHISHQNPSKLYREALRLNEVTGNDWIRNQISRVWGNESIPTIVPFSHLSPEALKAVIDKLDRTYTQSMGTSAIVRDNLALTQIFSTKSDEALPRLSRILAILFDIKKPDANKLCIEQQIYPSLVSTSLSGEVIPSDENLRRMLTPFNLSRPEMEFLCRCAQSERRNLEKQEPLRVILGGVTPAQRVNEMLRLLVGNPPLPFSMEEVTSRAGKSDLWLSHVLRDDREKFILYARSVPPLLKGFAIPEASGQESLFIDICMHRVAHRSAADILTQAYQSKQTIREFVLSIMNEWDVSGMELADIITTANQKNARSTSGISRSTINEIVKQPENNISVSISIESIRAFITAFALNEMQARMLWSIAYPKTMPALSPLIAAAQKDIDARPALIGALYYNCSVPPNEIVALLKIGTSTLWKWVNSNVDIKDEKKFMQFCELANPSKDFITGTAIAGKADENLDIVSVMTGRALNRSLKEFLSQPEIMALSLGKRLQRVRQKEGYSTGQFADWLNISEAVVQHFEKDETSITENQAKILATHFKDRQADTVEAFVSAVLGVEAPHLLLEQARTGHITIPEFLYKARVRKGLGQGDLCSSRGVVWYMERGIYQHTSYAEEIAANLGYEGQEYDQCVKLLSTRRGQEARFVEREAMKPETSGVIQK